MASHKKLIQPESPLARRDCAHWFMMRNDSEHSLKEGDVVEGWRVINNTRAWLTMAPVGAVMLEQTVQVVVKDLDQVLKATSVPDLPQVEILDRHSRMVSRKTSGVVKAQCWVPG
ncbi:hypothetical protein OH491_25000 [Termitidicoccus mucosus]|uniref:Uncharacterized protein n=1 Tax=Termitidicoccus mucosus TaxID=1184151 RepID=A0A178IPX2_9BACT|nr:hypothetical protein AW736_01545 [Opitutaceae bacterium TSB47]